MNLIFAAILLYFVSIFQISFLAHFPIWGFTPDLVLFIILIWNLLESRKKNTGLAVAIIGGLFLDIFSKGLMGFQIIIALILAIFIKWILKKNVRIRET